MEAQHNTVSFKKQNKKSIKEEDCGYENDLLFILR